MTRTLTSALVALTVLGSASAAFASGYVDLKADAIRNYGPVVQQQHALQSKPVALPQTKFTPANESWMDRASQNIDGGGN